jgi:hypothetical protein
MVAPIDRNANNAFPGRHLPCETQELIGPEKKMLGKVTGNQDIFQSVHYVLPFQILVYYIIPFLMASFLKM